MAKTPKGIVKFKGSWGIQYSYKGVQILRGSKHSTRYDFHVGDYRVFATNLVDAVEQIEFALEKQNRLNDLQPQL